MKILLTGGTGFIGSHFLRQALAVGHQVTALRRSPASRPRIPLEREPVWLDREMRKVRTDELAGYDVLVHLAAVGVSPQPADWTILFRVNVTESLALWLRAAEAGIKRFVICGSCFEYGRSAERYDFIPAAAPLEPVGAYGASKAAATMAALALAAEKRIEMIVLRPFHVFGEGQHEGNFWPSLKAAAVTGKDFPMTAGEQLRDFMPAEEVARAFLQAAQLPELLPGEPRVENVGTGIPQTLRAFAEHWWRTWQARGQLRIGAQPYRQGEVMRYVPAMTK